MILLALLLAWLQDPVEPEASSSQAASPTTVIAEAQESVVVKQWLVIAPVDRRGRRPFTPNAVFAKHLLDPESPPPKEGEKLSGELGKEQTWTRRETDANGSLGGGPVGAAFALIEAPREQVWLADLDGAAAVYVNGVPQVGDYYGDGIGGLPVLLREGENVIAATGMRGALRLELTLPKAPLLLNPFDATGADLVVGAIQEFDVAVLVVNATNDYLSPILLESGGDGAFAANAQWVRGGLGPLGILKVPVSIKPDEKGDAFKQPGPVDLPLRVRAGHLVAESTLRLEVKAPTALRRCSYVSGVDGSVQEFALLPATDPKADRLVLTLHGAGVDCMGQAAAYSAKPDFWIVAPTNRRRFGFDWQDWGRRDAYDVLAAAMQLAPIDRRHLYLTGHSMGGHGTWHLAANDPGTFAAIAPSAGWSGFDSYGGGRPEGALKELWQGADGASRTLDLIDNLKQLPTYILHGTADDNVPLSEAQLMLNALTKAGATPEHHFQGGAGHWWDGDAAPGADCVDWPGIFELFRKSELPESSDTLSFTTADPAVNARCRWITIEQPLVYGKPCRVDVQFDRDMQSGGVTTQNVRRMRMDLSSNGVATTWRIDGGPPIDLGQPPANHRRPTLDPRHMDRGVSWGLLRMGEEWQQAPASIPENEKRPDRCGPFKRAFDREFVLVYASKGTPPEVDTSEQRARYDAAHWWYRANGHAQVLRDDDFIAALGHGEYAACNVILYGNADTNTAWNVVIDAGSPIVARRGKFACGGKNWKGDDLAALFVQPRRPPPDSDAEERWHDGPWNAVVGLFADTGVAGARLGYTLSPFISGVGYPDYAIFSSAILTLGDGGVLAAGWFDHDWKLPGK